MSTLLELATEKQQLRVSKAGFVAIGASCEGVASCRAGSLAHTSTAGPGASAGAPHRSGTSVGFIVAVGRHEAVRRRPFARVPRSQSPRREGARRRRPPEVQRWDCHQAPAGGARGPGACLPAGRDVSAAWSEPASGVASGACVARTGDTVRFEYARQGGVCWVEPRTGVGRLGMLYKAHASEMRRCGTSAASQSGPHQTEPTARSVRSLARRRCSDEVVCRCAGPRAVHLGRVAFTLLCFQRGSVDHHTGVH